jgi:hypothetical protein
MAIAKVPSGATLDSRTARTPGKTATPGTHSKGATAHGTKKSLSRDAIAREQKDLEYLDNPLMRSIFAMAQETQTQLAEAADGLSENREIADLLRKIAKYIRFADDNLDFSGNEDFIAMVDEARKTCGVAFSCFNEDWQMDPDKVEETLEDVDIEKENLTTVRREEEFRIKQIEQRNTVNWQWLTSLGKTFQQLMEMILQMKGRG